MELVVRRGGGIFWMRWGDRRDIWEGGEGRWLRKGKNF